VAVGIRSCWPDAGAGAGLKSGLAHSQRQGGDPGKRSDQELLRNLPDMAAGIFKAGSPYAPGSIDRAVQELHSASG
jgi:hypothetical protein